MEGALEIVTDSLAERGQSEPPPIIGCADLLSGATAQNINTSHVGEVPQESPTTYFNEHHCSNILKVLKAQQSKAELCDTVLIVNNDHVPVHSCVIAANSPYLKALFDTSNLDRIPGQPLQISLPTTSMEVAQNLIGYMYSGDISITTNCVEELLQLTDKLMMDDVRQCCELHMIKSLDFANWSASHFLAKMHAFEDLAGEIIKFLAQNLMVVKNTTEFPCLPSSDVKQILNESNVNEGSDLELCKLEFLLNWVAYDYSNNVAFYEELLQCITPTLLSTHGVSKVFDELSKQELHDHELSKRLRTQVEGAERTREEEAKREKLIQEEEVQRAEQVREEEAKREEQIREEEAKREEQLRQEEAKRAAEEEKVKQEAEEEAKQSQEKDVKHEDTEKQTAANDSQLSEENKTKGDQTQAQSTVSNDGEGHADSDTEIEDNTEYEGEGESSPVVASDGNQYLEDGTLVIQPQSTWQGRGKRKSYKPKKIHSGRPRGRPRKNVVTHEEIESEPVESRPVRRRGRPPMNRSHVVKKIKAKTFGRQTKARTRPAETEVNEDEPNGVGAAGTADDLEFVDKEDNDPSWTPVVGEEDVAVEKEVVKVPSRRGRKRKSLAPTTPPIPREPKKRGRKPNPGDKTFYCQKCPRTFKSHGSLTHHMKGHGSETPMLCEVCGFSTRHYGSMNVHRRKHEGKVKHCPFEGCDHTEIHRARLDDHISAVHHGLKRHMCSICGKSFGAKKHLQRHEGLHGRAKDIACNLCNYVTNRTDKLREHIRKHHPIVAVDMGMLKPEDLNKASPPKPRTPKKPKEPKQPKKKKVPTATLR